MSLYSVVVPVYNSEHTLEELYRRLEKVFREVIKEDFELILVDDGSKDRSFEVMTELRNKDQRVRIIQMARNFGQHPALLCGFAHVRGDFVVTMDDDLQHQRRAADDPHIKARYLPQHPHMGKLDHRHNQGDNQRKEKRDCRQGNGHRQSRKQNLPKRVHYNLKQPLVYHLFSSTPSLPHQKKQTSKRTLFLSISHLLQNSNYFQRETSSKSLCI